MTNREFALELLKRASPRITVADLDLASHNERTGALRIEQTLMRAVELELEVGLSQDHLDALDAIMKSLSADQVHRWSDHEAVSVGDWALVYIDVLRIVALPVERVTPPNRAKSKSYHIQSSASVIRKPFIIDSTLPMIPRMTHDDFDPDDKSAFDEAFARLKKLLKDAPPLPIYVTPAPEPCPACVAFDDTIAHRGSNCWRHVR